MKKFLKIISPIVVLVVSIGIVQALGAAKPEPEKKEEAQRLISLYVDEVKSDTVTISIQTQGAPRQKLTLSRRFQGELLVSLSHSQKGPNSVQA